MKRGFSVALGGRVELRMSQYILKQMISNIGRFTFKGMFNWHHDLTTGYNMSVSGLESP